MESYNENQVEKRDKYLKKNWKKITVNSLKYMFFAFMGLVLFINLYIGVCSAVTKEAVPQCFGITPLVVLSGSMEPAIMPGDVVIVQKQDIDKYKEGDVATYLAGNVAYTHRIIAKEEGVFVFKGDSNTLVDSEVEATQLIGRVILRIPKIGVAILFFKTPPGMLLLVLIFILALYGDEIFRKIKKRND